MNGSRVTMPYAPGPPPAVLLGLGGLLPFVTLTASALFGPVAWRTHALTALSGYGAVILSFVGALHWGYAVRRSARGREAWVQYGFSVVPALVAWASLMLPVGPALRLQAVGLLACYLFDRIATRVDPVPEWFLGLRTVLTVLSVASLGLASL